MDTEQTAEIILRAKAQDQRAFATLYDMHWAYVHGFLLKQTKQPILAEEMALQTFAKAFDRIVTYDPKFNFRTWLISISKHIQIDHLKNKHTRAQAQFTSIQNEHYDTLATENASPEDQLIISQNLNELQQKIKQLKPQYGKIIRLRYFEEYSYKKIAVEIDAPINTVKVMLLRAKKLLAEKILSPE